MQIETLFHKGIHNCSGVTYTTVIRHPMERLYSHLSFDHVSATQVKDLLTGQVQSEDYVRNVWERRHLPCLHPSCRAHLSDIDSERCLAGGTVR